MITQLRGKIINKQPTLVVLESAGIGFEINVPLSTSRHLPDPPEEVTLLVVMNIGRNEVQLYGFRTREEKDTFLLITGVKGVGPKAALNLLSRFQPQEIVAAIAQGKTDLLKSAPGIGDKKAESIARLLRSRVPAPATVPEPSILRDAIAALISLGLTQKEARERLARLVIKPDTSLQEVLLFALRTPPDSGGQKP